MSPLNIRPIHRNLLRITNLRPQLLILLHKLLSRLSNRLGRRPPLSNTDRSPLPTLVSFLNQSIATTYTSKLDTRSQTTSSPKSRLTHCTHLGILLGLVPSNKRLYCSSVKFHNKDRRTKWRQQPRKRPSFLSKLVLTPRAAPT
jgi:hypothetical protein